jgi:energy-coupling factor transporter ATP-binding protein EcfA2
MKELFISLENCYGIGKLEYTFDFNKNSTYSIYAPNGVMKTSFANTFKRLSEKKEPEEKIYNRVPKWDILDDGTAIDVNKIVVIKSLETINTEKSQSTLLVDEHRKKEYDSINNEILEEKKRLILKLNKLSGEKQSDVETKILIDFNAKNLFEFLAKLNYKDEYQEYSGFKYQDIFNNEVLDFLKKPDVKNNIDSYFEKYNELFNNSKYFKKGLFNPSKADSISNELKKNNFFEAEHTVKLDGDEDEIDSFEKLNSKFNDERKAILENEELAKIENEIKKVAVQKFREISETNSILPELKDLNSFRKKLWYSYFQKEKESIESLIELYNNGIERLKEIESSANDQKTLWDDVVKKFKERFYMPYDDIIIENRASAILGQPNPSIVFIFKDKETGNPIELRKEDLEKINILSQGELRAMYLLNILFNIEVRKKENLETLFIIDDIADSFDYKNKYAIIQYLKELSKYPNFHQIILTHNFDFFRTITSRGIVHYDNSIFSYKTGDNQIKFKSAKEAKSLNNPFINDWKDNLSNTRKLIASIPFVRNIIEYTRGDKDVDYKILTKVLHIKSDSQTVTFSDIKTIFENCFPNIMFNISVPLSSNVIDAIFNESQKCLIESEGIDLENKLVLSIGIRLAAERFMWSKVSDKTEIMGFQTWKLFKRFRDENQNLIEVLSVLEQVILITPENIHINSFMYEPILDMSDFHLKKLYNEVIALD